MKPWLIKNHLVLALLRDKWPYFYSWDWDFIVLTRRCLDQGGIKPTSEEINNTKGPTSIGLRSLY